MSRQFYMRDSEEPFSHQWFLQINTENGHYHSTLKWTPSTGFVDLNEEKFPSTWLEYIENETWVFISREESYEMIKNYENIQVSNS